eukprot:11379133-Ditylum_brightwellii.AAC.1
MEAQSLLGIVVGQSNNSDGMMFFCPFNKEVYTTSQYHLNEISHTADDINLQYDSGMLIDLYLSQSMSKSKISTPPEQYPPGTEISFIRTDSDCIQCSVIVVPS